MPAQGEDFARYANAERELCDEAAPILASILRGIEARSGLCITEVRVTIDWAQSAKGSIAANCTIVGAHDPVAAGKPSTSAGNHLAQNRD